MVDLRMPPINGETEKEQLLQIKSYLHRLTEQLQWAFDTLTGEPNLQAVSPGRVSAGKQTGDATPASFSELKSMIIQSADIVSAYTAAVTRRLEGSYVARSQFGTYREETEAQLSANSTALEQLYTNTRTLEGTFRGLQDQVLASSAYLRTGLLAEEASGQSIYGLEVGQTNTRDGITEFQKFARFTADRLSFFDRNGYEVAYISDYALYITNARVAGQLELGSRFRITAQNGLIFQWTGGNT